MLTFYHQTVFDPRTRKVSQSEQSEFMKFTHGSYVFSPCVLHPSPWKSWTVAPIQKRIILSQSPRTALFPWVWTSPSWGPCCPMMSRAASPTACWTPTPGYVLAHTAPLALSEEVPCLLPCFPGAFWHVFAARYDWSSEEQCTGACPVSVAQADSITSHAEWFV
jgi:hypothetical protein